MAFNKNMLIKVVFLTEIQVNNNKKKVKNNTKKYYK